MEYNLNGKVNGIMEELMDTPQPNSPVETLEHKLNLENTDNDLSNHETNTVPSSDLNNCENNRAPTSDNFPSKLSPDNQGAVDSNDELSSSSQPNICNNETSDNVPVQENSNNSFIENHNSNSNESYQESENIDQVLPHLNDQGKINDNKTVNSEINENSEEELDSEEDSSDDEGSNMSAEPRANTLSINSDSDLEGGDETSQESGTKNEHNEIIILGNERPLSQNGNSHSPEVQEIESDNDDCVMAEEKPFSNDDNKVQLRRSSRAVKRRHYADDLENCGESDIEEIGLEDPLNRRSKPIVINDTKTLVEMAAKQMKSNHSNPKKEPTVVIIDTNSILSGKRSTIQQNKTTTMNNTSLNPHNLYQSIVARGTTVTPVSSKINSALQSSQSQSPAQPLILPSLTDDMFVVEAPSFIVPYVYEKPSVKPFREFVDTLGKELEEQRAKEEKELLEKQKEEKEKKDKEKQEKKDQGEEDLDDSIEKPNKLEEIETDNIDDKKKKKEEKRERRRRKHEYDDDASWDGESTSSSDEDALSDDENKTIVIKEKVESKIDMTGLTGNVDKVCPAKADNYFGCSLGKFFVNIGLNLVQEYVQTDLLKQQNRKLYREKKTGQNTKATESSIASLMKNLEFSKENNAPYTQTQKKCEFCSFKTESLLVMSHHLETPHMKNNVYNCNFCAFEIRSPHDILYHMEAEHNVRGKLERAPAYHQCANCPFEDNGKGKLARHLIACAKKYKPDLNLSPPVEWEPPAKIPKLTRSRHSMMGTYQNAFNRGQVGNLPRPAVNVPNIAPGIAPGYRPRGRSPMTTPARAVPVHGTPLIRGSVMVRHNAPVLMTPNYPAANNVKPKSMHQPSISITPLPRQPQPVQPQPSQHNKNTFVICEICDGYIKDLEQLRNHMQWIHKVKIHPKMIYNRPPLNCQKCQFRFFTDQGLERHLLGSHGLVTSSMQEAANKGKDAGRCPVCGRVYQWKLLNHVARDHSLTLKPAHLSYKCTVCTATFGMYKQFENHVYSAHSVVAKRVMDKSKTSTPPAKTNESLLKPLKINDEITIIPQPVKAAHTSHKEK